MTSPDICENHIRFVKQYGEKRTGTNYLRALLDEHFTNLVVLMHILGDKHGLPIDYEELFNNTSGISLYQKIINATIEVPSETTCITNKEEESYIKKISPELGKAIEQKDILFIIAIKNPYAWVYSMWKSLGWKKSINYKPLQAYLVEMCIEYNKKYRSWLTLAKEWQSRAMIIRYEDLILNEKKVIFRIKEQFNLVVKEGDKKAIDGVVLPTHWDNEKTQIHFHPFDKLFYKEKRYIEYLTPEIIQIIQNTIDWQLLSCLNYHIEDCYATD